MSENIFAISHAIHEEVQQKLGEHYQVGKNRDLSVPQFKEQWAITNKMNAGYLSQKGYFARYRSGTTEEIPYVEIFVAVGDSTLAADVATKNQLVARYKVPGGEIAISCPIYDRLVDPPKKKS